MSRLTNKRALVTGANTGLGREIALEFAREGADLILHFAHDEDAALEVQKQIFALGRKALLLRADFSKADEVASVGERALAAFGGVDCLVNNAGITFNQPFLEVTPEQFDHLWSVNIRAQYFITQAIVRDMILRGSGTICNLTSIHGVAGAPEHSAYAATKGAIIAFTRSLSVEVAHRGIRVNAIAPGWVTVESYAQAIPNFNEADAKKAAAQQIPLGRSGQKNEIAKLAVFLCSEDSGYIVGQTIVADGGTTALMSLISDFRTPSSARFGTGYMPGL